MGYEKQNWQTGQVITADKLNHMEDGIADSDTDAFAINISCSSSSSDSYTDFSVKESLDYIHSAIKAGKHPIVYLEVKTGAPYLQTYSFTNLLTYIDGTNQALYIHGFYTKVDSTAYINELVLHFSGHIPSGQIACSVEESRRQIGGK